MNKIENKPTLLLTAGEPLLHGLKTHEQNALENLLIDYEREIARAGGVNNAKSTLRKNGWRNIDFCRGTPEAERQARQKR